MLDKAVRLRWLAALLMGLAGCTTPQPNLKPPPQKEVLNVPPAGDDRFNQPGTPYPKETLNTDLLRKPAGPGGPVDPTGGRMGNFSPGAGFGR
jgi:hypothetical protein